MNKEMLDELYEQLKKDIDFIEHNLVVNNKEICKKRLYPYISSFALLNIPYYVVRLKSILHWISDDNFNQAKKELNWLDQKIK